MAITKNEQGVIVETPISDADQFSRTGVIRDSSFAVAAEDVLKQIKFDAGAQATNSSVVLKAGESSGEVVITLPSESGTLATTAGASSSFTTIQTDTGTSPTASGPTDTLTLEGDGSIETEGDADTDTVVFSVVPNTTNQKVAVSKGGAAVTGTRKQLNLIEGSGVTLTVADNSGSDRVDVTIATSGGTGDVVGPGSSTDEALARYDSTTGKLLQNSNALLNDTGHLGLGGVTPTTWLQIGAGSTTTLQSATSQILLSSSSNTVQGITLRNSVAKAGIQLNDIYSYFIHEHTAGLLILRCNGTNAFYIDPAAGRPITAVTNAFKVDVSAGSNTAIITNSSAQVGICRGANSTAAADLHIGDSSTSSTSTPSILMSYTSAGTKSMVLRNANEELFFQVSSGLAGFGSATSGTHLFIRTGGTTRAKWNATTGYLALGNNFVDGATLLELDETVTISGATSDGYAGALSLDPSYSAASGQTVTRHNYMDAQNVSGGANVTITDAALVRFDAAAGTHKAVDSGTTKTTPGGVDAWVKINVNGTIYYVPSYTSKTA